VEALLAPFRFPFMQSALLAAVLVGISCASIGVYVVLRRMAFIGDALSHTILPGLVYAYLNQMNLFVGAIVAGVLTALGIGWLSRRDEIREDTAIGIMFTGMFALGILMMSTIRSFRDLSHILFGNILGVTHSDLAIMAVTTLGILIVLAVFHKELELTSVDPTHGEVIGLRASRMRYLLLVLLAFTVVSSIQVVGVIMTSALLITPAATASLLTNRLVRMMGIAVVVAVASGIIGLYASYYADVASGAAIVLACTAFFLAAWLWQLWRQRGGSAPIEDDDTIMTTSL
jgi:manganese/iron transport system permease protein